MEIPSHICNDMKISTYADVMDVLASQTYPPRWICCYNLAPSRIQEEMFASIIINRDLCIPIDKRLINYWPKLS